MIDTLIYEKNSKMLCFAGLKNGRMILLETVDLSRAVEGNIYLGKITKKIDLANGKCGYFVNIGKDKDAFINAEEYGRDELNANEGQEVIVQVAQEQRAEKGAKLVRSLQFVGQNLVYCPYKINVETSSKITDKLKADELKKIVNDNMTGQEGWIIRTSAIYVDEKDVVEEMGVLRGQFDVIRQKAKTAKAPALLLERKGILTDILNNNENLQKIVLNDHNLEEVLKDDFEVEFSLTPLKDYNIEDFISEALQKEVKLKNGGRITIEETKACVAIDVDSGSDDGLGSLGRLNIEAAEEIVHQIRLRNLSGKIVIDFAGSSEYRFLKNIIEYLEENLRKDNVKTFVNGLSRSGLVEITRVRRRPSLSELWSEECPTCKGSGKVEK